MNPEPFILGIIIVLSIFCGYEARRTYRDYEPTSGLVISSGYCLAILILWVGYGFHICVK